MNMQDNLAYDLSLFDDDERQRREINEKERAKEKAVAADIKMAKNSVSRSGSRIKVIAVAASVFAAFFAANYFNTQRDDMARMVQQQRQAYDEAVNDNSLLRSQLDYKVSIGYIEEYATEELGMQKVTGAQKKYISVNTEDLIEVEHDDSGGFFGSIKKWFGDILEYIGF